MKAERAATTADLACSIEPVGTQPEGGLPAGLRLTIRNTATAAVALVLPRPLVADVTPPPGGDELPLPIMALVMKDAAGHEESPAYTNVRARSWPKAGQTALAPGGTWSAEYPLTDFYFWGPCGPDTGGSFTKYFWRGDKELTLALVLVFDGGRRLESAPIRIRCNFEDWLFAKKR